MQLNIADAAIAEIRKLLDYQLYMTPNNYNEENALFLERYQEKRVYNPQYTYRRFDSTKAIRILDSIDLSASPSTAKEKIMHSSLVGLLDEIDLYKSLGNNDLFTNLSIAVHGTPSEEYRQRAIDYLNTPDEMIEDSSPRFSAYDLREMIKHRLNEYGFTWQIKVMADMASRVSVEPDEKTIYINERKMFTAKDVERLKVHEVDTHVLRAENGERRGYRLFVSGTQGSLAHEEGLALFNELKHGVADRFSTRLYGARYLCCLEIDKSFYELFDMLLDYGCDADFAMYVVARIKRGLSDTSLPGGFIKDYVYLQGLCEVADAIEKDPGNYARLYYGAISLADVSTLFDEIEELIEARSLILPIQ